MIFMKITPHPLLLVVAVLVCTLPSARLHSQAVPLPAEPLAALQTLQSANDDLIKRQETTLKDLSDITDDAREIRIYSKRG